ncbi:MAG: hypothetical protein KDJ86_09635 [Bauldia sp.]|uniref:hypothetical protein n=1 Tax=Bauldia sp. TaxID=2575872 RepID=UPI001DFCFA81|nr:hypothetical protein [Bauldia sp.]MCB1496034.1 hypothetical protein [Bauldia sp.]
MIDRRQLQNRPPRARPRDDEEPIITYSRVEAGRPASPHDLDGFEPAAPLYEAVEVPRATRPPPRDAFVDEPELRAERDFDPAIDPLAPEPRPRRFRLLVAFGIAAIALIAGVGVLLATLGPSGPVATTASRPASPPLLEEPADAATGDDMANTAPNVRQIPIVDDGGQAGGDTLATAPAATAEPIVETVTGPEVVADPPAPRLRPTQPATVTVSTDPGLPAAPATIDGEPAPAAAPAAESDEDFLRRIEQTLNRVEQASGTPATTAAPVVVEPPAAIPVEPATSAAIPAEPVVPANTNANIDLIPADELVIDDPAGGDDMMMDGGGHFDFEMDEASVPDAATTTTIVPVAPPTTVAPDAPATTTIAPLPTPPADIGPAPQLADPQVEQVIVDEAPAPPPARQGPLQRLFPRLLPPADAEPAN